jgi:hypothetical protein
MGKADNYYQKEKKVKNKKHTCKFIAEAFQYYIINIIIFLKKKKKTTQAKSIG